MNILSLCNHKVIISVNKRDAEMLFNAFSALRSDKEFVKSSEQDDYEQRRKNYAYIDRHIKRFKRMKDGLKQ